MANTPHPLDIVTDDLTGTVRRLIVRAFMRPDPDGEVRIDDLERTVIAALDGASGTLLQYRKRQVANDSWERNGDTRITRDRFREAGYDLVELARERRKRTNNVVPIRRELDAG